MNNMEGKKLIHTGKSTILVIKVAPDASNFRISKGYPDPPAGDLAYDTDLNIWKTGDAILPEEGFTILGIAATLSEEHLEMILPNTFAGRRFSHFRDILKASGFEPDQCLILQKNHENTKNNE